MSWALRVGLVHLLPAFRALEGIRALFNALKTQHPEMTSQELASLAMESWRQLPVEQRNLTEEALANMEQVALRRNAFRNGHR